ncbi:pyruvate kinase alpha/beta domain-containing protein, partial [Klebsiella pneumoniae]
RGVYPMHYPDIFTVRTDDHVIFDLLKKTSVVKSSDYVIITQGDLSDQIGATNALRVVKVA